MILTITIYHSKKSVVFALASDEIEAHLSHFVVCTFIAKMIQESSAKLIPLLPRILQASSVIPQSADFHSKSTHGEILKEPVSFSEKLFDAPVSNFIVTFIKGK